MKLAFVALFLLLTDYMESAGTIEDLVVHYYDKNISTIDLLRRLNMSYARFDVQDIKCPRLFEYSCETVCPLENEDQERIYRKACYCDKLCVEFGDCCFDYFLRCTAAKTAGKPWVPKLTCVTCSYNQLPFITDNYGYAMVSSCSQHNADKNLESLCTSKADFFGMLPVSDFQNRTTYKNVFCASCNQASNLTYWIFAASCVGYTSYDIPTNRSLMLAFIMRNCQWDFEPPRGHSEKVCLAVKENCPDSELVDKEPLLRDLCSFYSFPVCPDFQPKNPHCDICKGKDISQYSCICRETSGEVGGLTPPSLNILFAFSSSSQSVEVGERKSIVRNKVCAEGSVFDPFKEECVQIHVPMSVPERRNINTRGSINGPSIKGFPDGTFINCSYVKMNISAVTILSNGSIWIPLHKRIYNKERYAINGSALLLCADFKRVYTETETLVSMEITPLQILTYTGCTISMMSLISLLGIYIALPELRTLPGENLMSLSCAMLLYHIFFLLTGQTDKPNLCMAVSVLLHYLLLSSFCWMGVMAFDVEKTFGAKGKARPRHDDNRKTLVKYSIFAWITPAVIVITSVTLDKTNTVIIGYAEVFCWISNGRALLLVLGVPVAMILLFNVGALTLTMISIWKVQKTTRRVTDQSNQTCLPILYIKLSSVMGFTWILGFIEPFTKVEFLAYLFVILNSLQGFFIFLAFVANKRTLNKVRAGWMARFHRLGNTDTATPQSRETRPSELVTSTL